VDKRHKREESERQRKREKVRRYRTERRNTFREGELTFQSLMDARWDFNSLWEVEKRLFFFKSAKRQN
jgi:hypothetical protein